LSNEMIWQTQAPARIELGRAANSGPNQNRTNQEGVSGELRPLPNLFYSVGAYLSFGAKVFGRSTSLAETFFDSIMQIVWAISSSVRGLLL